jgi:uncharacterized protein YutE (UPF0331/DUF86 family)
MDDPYRFAMQEQIGELEEALAEIASLLQQQGAMTTLIYRATERNLQLLIETCIGIARQTLKAQGKQVPGEARQVFEKLKAEGLDNSNVPWSQVIGMRNALVHDYLNLDRERIADVVRNGNYRALIDFANAKLT